MRVHTSGSKRKTKQAAANILEAASGVGIQVGSLVFLITTLYLIWVILSGRLTMLGQMPSESAQAFIKYMMIAAKALVVSGVALSLGIAIRHYADEVTGYVLLILGAVLQWGLPLAFGTRMGTGNNYAGWYTAQILHQFQIVSMTAMIAAIPLVLMDFYYKLLGMRRDIPMGAVVPKDEKGSGKSLQLFCWQMSYCREFLRPSCKAFQRKRPCWWLKEGCYCAEEMLLAAMNKNRAPVGVTSTSDRLYSQGPSQSKSLTPSQKRERCRQCFIYAGHQTQKYRMMSPLVFPLVIGLMWKFFGPIKGFLDMALNSLDAFAGIMTIAQRGPGGISIGNFSNPVASNTADWIFLICAGIALASYMLRVLEYFIFKLQV